MATPDPRHAYVSFYLSVLDDLDRAIASLAAADTSSRGALSTFAAAVGAAGLTPSPMPAISTPGLWRPVDPVQLTGLTDIYEVVGRFSFQGEDNANVAGVGTVASSLRAEVLRQRSVLASMGEVPARAVARADALDADDQASARAQQSDALKQFEPVAAELRKLCATLLDAIRAVRKPDLSRTETAETLYQDYLTRVRALYARALPYLRSELVELSRVAGCEVPPSWPESLAFAPTLPADLVATPTLEGPALAQARAAAEAMAAQEAALQRAQDELGVQLRRVEGEATALAQREPEADRAIATGRAVVRWASKLDEAEVLRARAGGTMAEAMQREQLLAQVAAEGHRTMEQIGAVQTEATEWAQGVMAKESAVAQVRQNEPAIFGKDDWRRKVEELDAEVSEARTELARRQQSLAALNGELARLRTRDQAERGQVAGLKHVVDESRAREAAVQREVADIEKELAAARPTRRMAVAQAEEAVTALQSARAEGHARIDRLGAEARRIREDLDRAAVQLKQVAVDRQRQQGVVAQSSQAAVAVQADAVRVLASRRQAGFESHVAAVLSGLEESLAQVDRVFIDPARRILLERLGVSTGASAALRAEADQLAKTLPEIRRAADQALDAVSPILDRIERDFVEKAPEACRAAWA